MENKKPAPATQQPQHPLTHHAHSPAGTHPHLHNHPAASLSSRLASPQPYQLQPNGIMHQLLMQSPSGYRGDLRHDGIPDARSPLLENQQELYGTRQSDYRQYGAGDSQSYLQPDARQDVHRSVNRDVVHAVPKGYNVEVYQDYMKRNPPKDPNLVYQSHQHPSVNQYTSKPYLPYTNRIQPSESNTELLRRQYTEIQQMKLRQQMRYQTEAQMQQQQTFAERQLLLQQLHGVQPPPNLQQNIYSEGHYGDERYIDREERYEVQSPASTYQSRAQTKQNPGPTSPMKSSGESSSPSVKSPASGESRRSGAQALRSPVAQRPASAPVAMSGLLYKQGSDGLKVWRKRWFVLAEYCLFYYKSQDEDKLLGSVLLPSYAVSACTAEDRVLRKFAFKLEHANMRTYILAAPDQEQAVRWVKALTMAALMQDTRNPDEKRKQTDRSRASVEKEEEGDETAGPTYANAPPKPRRSNDGYNSPTPDIYDPNYDILQKPASHYSQGTNQNRYTETNQNRCAESNQNRCSENNPNRYAESNQNCYPETNMNRYSETNQNRYSELNHVTTTTNTDNTPQSPQYFGTKRPYDLQALSLPLTNTSSDRLENTLHSIPQQHRNDSQPLHYDNRARSYQQQQQKQHEQKSNDERLNEQIYGRNQTQSLLYTKEKGQSEMPREMDLQNRNYNPDSAINKLQPRTQDTQKIDDANFDGNIYSRENFSEKPIRVGSKAPSTERLHIERRTPDAYGRSAPASGYSRGKASDYEDVYPSYSADNEYGMSYSKPTSPPSLAEKKSIPPTPNYQPSQPTDYSANYTSPSQSQGFNGPSVLRKKKMQSSNLAPTVQRPHSADFLEYESKNESLNKTMPARNVYEPTKQPQRPKSSLDINSYYDPSSDRYYSEESYAEKMRQSAQYLQQRGLSTKEFQVPLAKYTSGLAQKQLDSYTHNVNNNYERGYVPPQPKDNISYNSRYGELEALNSNWTLKEKSALESERECANRTGSAMSDGSSGGAAREAARAQDGFMRSASARLPAAATPEEGKDGEKKVQQREESMKRLLEWKQRMLQSPLTRKSTPASISLARSLNQSRQASHRASEQLKNKTSTYTNASYNSYSSDDEEQASDIEPHVRRETQAGRSQTDSPLSPRVSQTEHPPPLPQRYAKSHSATPETRGTSAQNTPTEIETAECTYQNITCTPPVTRLRVESNKSNNSTRTSDPTHDTAVYIDSAVSAATESDVEPESDDSEAESEKQMEYTDDDLDEVLYQSNTELNKNPDKCVEEKQDIKSDVQEKPETPPANSQPEDHYFPMSPRKNSTTVEPAHQNIIKHLSVFDGSRPPGVEDNPYVEMSSGNELEEMQTYEIVCVNNGKIEPVYMELNNLSSNGNDGLELPRTVFNDTASNFADTKDLTLKRISKDEKSSRDLMQRVRHKRQSDCSDADDESSKDISLNTPFNRFSISDNFRPASYYLGGSRNVLETQDSSDSEIMTPPPIPTSKPVSEDFGDDLSRYVLDKLDKSNLSEDNSILKLLQSDENIKLNTVKRKATSLMIYGSRHSIHDTLFRGEKIRHSRASSSNDSKSKDADLRNCSLLSSTFLQHYNSNRSIETDSLMSYNADQASSRMSLDSDVSSKFDRTPSNVSSERTCLNENESAIEFRNPNMTQLEIEKIMKRRPLSDDSFFEMDSLESNHINEAIGNVDLDQYLDNLQSTPQHDRSTRPLSDNDILSMNSSLHNESSTSRVMTSTDKLNEILQKTPIISHTRSSSTPVGRSFVAGSVEIAANISSLYKGAAGARPVCNMGSQSSISSVEATTAPLSYYSKNYTDEVDSSLNKNLNRAISADKIKEFEGDKIVLRNNADNDFAQSSSVVFHSRDSSTEHTAPYYYSDLSSQEHINVLPTHHLKNTNLNRKLNNQRRRGPHNKKNEITHIHNPIHNSQQVPVATERPFELAAAARCVSVEFLSAADKNPEIDMKNIYESAALKTPKIRDSMSSLHSNYSSRHAASLTADQNDGYSPLSQTASANSSRSENATNISINAEEGAKDSSRSSDNSSKTVFDGVESDTYDTLVCEGDMLWDEDALWRDNLRRASHRHARSMDDLDALPAETHRPGRCSVDLNAMKKSQGEKKESKNTKISRNVTYVNEDIQNQIFGTVKRNDKSDLLRVGQVPNDAKIDDDDVYVSLACKESLQEHSDEGVYEQLTIESSSDPSAQSSLNSQDATGKDKKRFEIDRENLRQWDLMSSGLMKKGLAAGASGVDGVVGGARTVAPPTDTDSGADSATNEASVSVTGGAPMGPNAPNQQPLAKKSFVGSNTSIGRSGRDNNIPVRAVSPRVRWVEDKPSGGTYGSQNISSSQQNLSAAQESWATGRSPSRQSLQPVRAVSPRVRRHTHGEEANDPPAQPPGGLALSPSVERLLSANLTAGELLGRSHEELVLLLIQLRRRRAATHHAAAHCTAQINSIKDCLGSLSALERQESLQRLEQLKLQLMDLEQQYEKSKPLVHLVDNMVKLGSLYNRPAAVPASTIERLERNQRLRQKVLAEQAEEQRRWAAGEAGDAVAARARVQELWALERELAAEAATLHGLKADKELIETLLTGVRSKFGAMRPAGGGGGAAGGRAPGADSLEAELARVHALLAHNSKKLEATVADNARLERELLSLRRALHTHRHAPATHTPTTALLEDEVARVQQLVSALQQQRQELSRAVRHLTHQSRALQTGAPPAQPPPASESIYESDADKRRLQNLWLETDLDSGKCIKHGLDEEYEDSEGLTTAATGHYNPTTGHYDAATRKYDLTTGNYDPVTGHYDPAAGHYNPATGHYDPATGQYNPTTGPYDPATGQYNRANGPYDPATEHYDLETSQYDLTTGHYDPAGGHYDPATGHYDPTTGPYDTREGQYDATRNHYDDNMQPLYVDTRGQNDVTSPVTSDDGMLNGLGNLNNVEKQEIKTVRIVKRESERRHRDRDRSIPPGAEWSSANIAANLDHLLEEELAPNHYTGRATSLPRTQPLYPRQEDYYKSRNEPPNYLQLANVNVPCSIAPSMQLSPKFPSSPSLSSYDYSRDISSLSSSYNRSYDYPSHDRTLSMSTQFLNSPTDSSRTLTNDPLSKTSSIGSLTRNAELSPIFKSEAAKQIITEMSGDGPPKSSSSLHRRQIPKEKRRHYTAPHHLSAKTLSEMPSEYFSQDKMGRSLDDADMERALRAPPDVVRSALAPQRYAESTIDRLLLAPRKIVIPERYIPERPPELSPEEQKKRLEKVESIKKMLSSTPSSDANKSPDGEERKQRQHLLQMNQILAKQVMEMSKIVAEKALEELPAQDSGGSAEHSPDVELPIYQQRDNFFT